MRILASVVLVTFGLSAQVPQPRDGGRRDARGTAIIRGRVVAADTGSPIRRANVSLQPAAPPIQLGDAPSSGASPVNQAASAVPPGQFRQTTTDFNGAFEFKDVVAGHYRIFASPGPYQGQYGSLSYGAKTPMSALGSDPGVTFPVADRQTIDKLVVALPRGAVISGRVMDEDGMPLSRVQVYAIAFPSGSPRGLRVGSGALTDDLGQFRLYGLQSGEFVIAADARGNTFVPPSPNGSREPEGDQTGFVTTYFPGAMDESAAQRVRARAGSETSGVDIRLGTGRLFRVSGTVVDSRGKPVPRGNGQLIRRGALTAGPGMQNYYFTTEEAGTFQMRNVPPGDYRLVMQYPNSYPEPPGPQPDPEVVNLPLTVGSSDIDHVDVMLRPGTTITGQVFFEQEPPTSTVGQVRVLVAPANPDEFSGNIAGTQSQPIRPDLTFTLKGLLGEYFLRAFAPNQYIKAVTANGEDITDTPREFKATDRLVVTLTSRASIVEGIVTDAQGAVPAGTGVIMFSDEKALWHTNATRTKRAGVDPNGSYRINGLMPGRYYIAAIPRERLTFPAGAVDAAYFEQLSKDAAPVIIGDNERRRMDLRVLQAFER